MVRKVQHRIDKVTHGTKSNDGLTESPWTLLQTL